MTEREALEMIALKIKTVGSRLNKSASTLWPSQAISFLWELHGIAKQGLYVPPPPLTEEQKREHLRQRIINLGRKQLP